MVNYKDLGLVNTKEMFAKAIKGGYAIPAFNFNNMEQMQAIIKDGKKKYCRYYNCYYGIDYIFCPLLHHSQLTSSFPINFKYTNATTNRQRNSTFATAAPCPK